MRIIAVSDIHLGYKQSNQKDFLRFLQWLEKDEKKIDHLVLLGDIFDFWRRTNANVVLQEECVPEIIEILSGLRKKMNIHYVIGNHDYLILKFAEKFGTDYPFTVKKYLRLQDREQGFYFTHGYDLDVTRNMEPFSVEEYEAFAEKMCYSPDPLGSVASFFWGIIEWIGIHLLFRRVNLKSFNERGDDFETLMDLAASPGVDIFLGKHPGDFLIFGHTHIAGFYTDKNQNKVTVINTGAWIDDPPTKDGIPQKNPYALIENGKMTLEYFT